MGRLLFRPRAWQDITETAEYLEAESGIELAERFIDAVKKTAESLLKMPMIGSRAGSSGWSCAIAELY